MLGCSSVSHTWDAFQLAHASFRLHCVRNNHVQSVKLGPRLLGDAPKINISPPETEMVDEEGSSEVTPAIKIYDEECWKADCDLSTSVATWPMRYASTLGR